MYNTKKTISINTEYLNLENQTSEILEIKLEELYKIKENIDSYISQIEAKIYLPF